MLAVVEDQEQVLAAEIVDERVDNGLSRRRLGAESAGDLGADESRIGERCELDEPGAVRVAIELSRRSLQCEPGLPGPADTDERQQAMGIEQSRNVGQLALAPNECGDLHGKIRWVPRRGAQWREVARQSRRH